MIYTKYFSVVRVKWRNPRLLFHTTRRSCQEFKFCEAVAGALMLPAWKVGDRGFDPRSGIQVSKKQNVSSLLTRKDYILWGASVTDKKRTRPRIARARICNLVSGGQCHRIHLTVLKRFSWPSLACMCTKVTKNPIHFISFIADGRVTVVLYC